MLYSPDKFCATSAKSRVIDINTNLIYINILSLNSFYLNTFIYFENLYTLIRQPKTINI
jgi:hypothetical protein